MLTAAVVVVVSEVAKRSDKLGARIASLPLVTVLALYGCTWNSNQRTSFANHAVIVWYVIPTYHVLAFHGCSLALVSGGRWAASVGADRNVLRLFAWLFDALEWTSLAGALARRGIAPILALDSRRVELFSTTGMTCAEEQCFIMIAARVLRVVVGKVVQVEEHAARKSSLILKTSTVPCSCASRRRRQLHRIFLCPAFFRM